MNTTSTERLSGVDKFREFILDRDHPCLMAQSIFKNDNFRLKQYGEIGRKKNAVPLLDDLRAYIESYDFRSMDFFTFIAVFDGRDNFSEKTFEERLWKQLQFLHDLDDSDWDKSVDSDPASDHFSFSVGGRAFYLVGMHPRSSRKARRSPKPCIVFNLHWQFEQLRQKGAYQMTRDKIRERDKELQGSNNPMLSDFGHDKEARQYSGRAVGDDWKCPFHPKK